MISSFTLAMGNIGAARKLHHNLLLNKLHTPQSFFDTTPIGRIINRFSKDIYVIDEALPTTVLMLLGTVFVSLSTIIVISCSTPIFLVVIVPLAFIYVFVQVLGKMLPIFCLSSLVFLFREFTLSLTGMLCGMTHRCSSFIEPSNFPLCFSVACHSFSLDEHPCALLLLTKSIALSTAQALPVSTAFASCHICTPTRVFHPLEFFYVGK